MNAGIQLFHPEMLTRTETCHYFYAAEDLPVSLTHNQWQIVEKVVNILGLFQEATAVVSTDDAYISMVIQSPHVMQKNGFH